MKKGRLLLLAMLLVGMCFLFGCVRKDIPEENDPDSATPPLQSSSQSSTQPPTASNEEISRKDEIKQSAKDSLMDFFNEDDIKKISVSEAKTEVDVTTDFEAGEDIPENWESICENLINASESLTKAMQSVDIQNAVISLTDTEGNNILVAMNTKITYSKYEKYDVSTDNPPTISLEEFNAIRTGMTYQEVYDIVGGPGELLSEVDIGSSEYHTMLYKWEGEGSLGANANVTFQGGKVSSKAQFGLEQSISSKCA